MLCQYPHKEAVVWPWLSKALELGGLAQDEHISSLSPPGTVNHVHLSCRQDQNKNLRFLVDLYSNQALLNQRVADSYRTSLCTLYFYWCLKSF